MKFGRILREKTISEWSFFAVDYKQLKKSLKIHLSISSDDESVSSSTKEDSSVDSSKFDAILEESVIRLSRFYEDKERWATTYISTLEENVEKLKRVSCDNVDNVCSDKDVPGRVDSFSCVSSVTSDESDSANRSEDSFGSPKAERIARSKLAKEEFRQVAHSPIFKSFIYAKKSLTTFERELDLLMEFLQLNATAFSKILKKFDKRTGLRRRESRFAEIKEALPFLDGQVLLELKRRTECLIGETNMLKPDLPKGWEERKVYTIGCFDLFHRGHANGEWDKLCLKFCEIIL